MSRVLLAAIENGPGCFLAIDLPRTELAEANSFMDAASQKKKKLAAKAWLEPSGSRWKTLHRAQ